MSSLDSAIGLNARVRSRDIVRRLIVVAAVVVIAISIIVRQKAGSSFI